jgi:ketosteroid isomerase-like protein
MTMPRALAIASTTLLLNVFALPALAAPVAPDEAANIVSQFHEALKRGDANVAIAQLSADALIYESGYAETHENYLAHHLQADIEFAKQTTRKVTATTSQCGETLCVLMQESETTGSYKGKLVQSIGVETSVLVRAGDTWKIQHVHWSSRK